jgi:hypothetical protein
MLALGATLSASCTMRDGVGQAAAPINAMPKLGDFVLYGQRSVNVGSFTHVDGGDVGVGSVAAMSTGTQLMVGDHALMDAHHNLLAPSTTLGLDAKVGDVQTSQLVNAGATLGQEAPYPSPMPYMPLAGPAQGGSDVDVADHGSQTLSPGAYGALTVGEHATVTLAPGSYSFASVTLAEHAELDGGAGPVVVTVGGALSIADHDNVVPGNGSTAGQLAFLVSGGDAGASAPAVSVGQHASVTALIAAPNGTVSIGAHAHATGAFVGFDVVTADHVLLDFQDGFAAGGAGTGAGSQQLHGYYGNPTDGTFALTSAVSPSTPIHLAIGLPFRNGSAMKDAIKHVSDPKDPSYRKYPTFDQIKQSYGATDADYAALKAWATASGLSIVSTLQSNMLIAVSAPASTVAAALHANLVMRNRMDHSGTQFLTVDREPSIDLAVPILWIRGLDEYKKPASSGSCGCSLAQCCPPSIDPPDETGRLNGTGRVGFYRAADLRQAYLEGAGGCLGLDGSGQRVGLLVGDGWNDADVLQYQMVNGLPQVAPQIGYGANPGQSSEHEPILDISMVAAMAPRAQVFVYFGGSFADSTDWDTALYVMAEDQVLTTASTSYNFASDDNDQQALDWLALQGISFFAASGDYGAIGDPGDIRDLENVTLVGGSFLSTNPLASGGTYPTSGTYYAAENTWTGGCPYESTPIAASGCVPDCASAPTPANTQSILGHDITSGGVMNGTYNTQMYPTDFPFAYGNNACECFPTPGCCSGPVPIPDYQLQVQALADTNNGGSTANRNYPDVALVADNIEIWYDGAAQPEGGTSAAAPLWAGFAALVNQSAHSNGEAPLGFANPVLYDIGITRGLPGGNDLYSTSFHDVKDHAFNGNNLALLLTCDPIVQGFETVEGYDLTTGLGSPTCGLVNLLASSTPLVPQTFSFMQVHVATGYQGPALTSIISLLVYGPDYDTLMCVIPLKEAGDGSWDNGTVIDTDVLVAPPSPFCSTSGPIRWSDISRVALTYDKNSGDPTRSNSWDVGGFGIRLHDIRTPELCVVDLSTSGGCFGGCNTDLLPDGSSGVVELGIDNTYGEGTAADFILGVDLGCNGTTTPPSATPIEKLEFLLDTGDDNPLAAGVELTADVWATEFDTGAPLDHFVLHGASDLAFPKDSELQVVRSLTNPGVPIDHVTLRLVTPGAIWSMSGVQIWGLAADENAQTCLALYPNSTVGNAGASSSDPLTIDSGGMLKVSGGCP